MIGKFLGVLIVGFLIVLLSTCVEAQDIKTHGLTDIQRAQLVLQTAETISKNASGGAGLSSTTPEDVMKYVEIGEAVGKAIGSAARELGEEVNGFADSKVGKIAIVLIIWHLFGEMAVHIVLGASFFCIAMIIWSWSFRKMACKTDKKVVSTTRDGKTVKEVIYTSDYTASDRGSAAVVHWFVFGAITIVTVFITFSW